MFRKGSYGLDLQINRLITYTVSPFINISGLSLIKLVRTQASKFFMVNCWKNKIYQFQFNIQKGGLTVPCSNGKTTEKGLTFFSSTFGSTFTSWIFTESHRSSSPPLVYKTQIRNVATCWDIIKSTVSIRKILVHNCECICYGFLKDKHKKKNGAKIGSGDK